MSMCVGLWAFRAHGWHTLLGDGVRLADAGMCPRTLFYGVLLVAAIPHVLITGRLAALRGGFPSIVLSTYRWEQVRLSRGSYVPAAIGQCQASATFACILSSRRAAFDSAAPLHEISLMGDDSGPSSGFWRRLVLFGLYFGERSFDHHARGLARRPVRSLAGGR